MSVETLIFRTHGRESDETRPIALRTAVVAGWTGRQRYASERRIVEVP